jgi:D-amino peptidase
MPAIATIIMYYQNMGFNMNAPTYRHILIIADIEGSSGCGGYRASSFLTRPWAKACAAMSRDVDAVVKALFDAGVELVTVKDFHRTGYNLLPEMIDRRAAVVCGYRQGPVPGLGDPKDADGVMMLGMHAAAGTSGFLAHTLTSRLAFLKVNGRPLAEVELFAAALAPFGIPAIFFSGCPVACTQARQRIPGIQTFSIDKSIPPQALDADRWRKGLARSAVEALSNRTTQPYRPQGPFRADIAIRDGAKAAAKMADRWGFDRTGARVHIDAPDMDTLYNYLIRLCYLPPLAEKTLPFSLMLFNAIGWLGRLWVRRQLKTFPRR